MMSVKNFDSIKLHNSVTLLKTAFWNKAQVYLILGLKEASVWVSFCLLWCQMIKTAALQRPHGYAQSTKKQQAR